MRKALLIGCLFVLTGVLSAGEKKLMHCFAFTTIKEASDADWKAFQAATDELPKTMSGVVSRVWHGKLLRNLNIFNTDGATSKKLAAGETDVTGPVSRVVRSYGVCLEMPDATALKAYAAHASHKEWVAAYEKVRVAGTTTYDILGQ